MEIWRFEKQITLSEKTPPLLLAVCHTHMDYALHQIDGDI